MSNTEVILTIGVAYDAEKGWYYQISATDFPPPDGPHFQCGPHDTAESNIECCEHNAPIFVAKFLEWKKTVTN